VASNLDLNAPQDPETEQLMDAARRIFEDLVDAREVS
jgi:hypothetical protein